MPATCVVVGPSNAGKTTMLCALNEVSGIASLGGPRVSVNLDVNTDEGRELAQYWTDILLQRRKPIGSSSNSFYSASVTAEVDGWFRPRVYESRLVFHDGPGGALFPGKAGGGGSQQAMRQFRDDLVQAGREAETLVLVVGVPERDSQVDVNLLANLDAALNAMTVEIPPEVSPWDRFNPFRGLRDIWRREPLRMTSMHYPRRLPCKRFLLLINKIDQLCMDGLTDPHLRVDEFARNIDPVGQACSLYGAPLLRKMQAKLRDDCTFAVGLMSATGFDADTGRPFFDRTGQQYGVDDMVTPEEMLGRVRPFGLVEALAFMVTGECHGPVATVPRTLREWDPYEPTQAVGESVVLARCGGVGGSVVMRQQDGRRRATR